MTARDDVAERVKRALDDPVRVARFFGLDEGAQRQAGGLLIRCPMPAHGDRGPSCSLTVGSDGTLRVKCFGCDLAGDVYSLIAAVHDLDARRDFREVLFVAADLAGVELKPAGSSPPRAAAPAPAPTKAALVEPSPAAEPDRFAELVAPLLQLGRLDGAPLSADVCRYLDARGLLAAARADGWAAFGALAAWARMLRDIFGADELERSGLMRPNGGGFVWPDHVLVIPWRGSDGAVTTVQRRRLDAGDPKYVFATGRKPAEPYGAHRLRELGPNTTIVYCEGAVDALALGELNASRGLDRVVLAIPGVTSWRAEWAAYARGRRAAVALDADGAGDGKAQAIADDLHAAGALEVLRVRPHGGAKDWADLWALERERMRGAA